MELVYSYLVVVEKVSTRKILLLTSVQFHLSFGIYIHFRTGKIMQPIGIETYPTHSVIITPPPLLGPQPMRVTCGNCQRSVLTTTVRENGACAYIATLFVCLLCCPCFWIPLCLDSCKDVQHACPGCGARLGTYKKI
ncbi:lipopolysaccharide-induced tumor necrosis factor-alpha factor-like protein [Nephila pilipes]|uniref:Lipopolysaccharide-induced tumor necrosis factor-alpha factor-like protein n=1 Tax=Nephila pilipes TaxID=299642 RepID=A0A8X6NMM8_NEPPI|nr:lipopolysaccharide-induced tumor necrosis factor-alpha factor-like protein [Nephila pilipes]